VRSLVFDATPLIYLTGVGLSSVFRELKGDKYTSPRVRAEVVDEGMRLGVPDAIILDEMFRDGVFVVREPVDGGLVERLLGARGLHVTDAEVIALAGELGGTAILDDEAARKTAKVYGVSYAGTPFVLMRSVGEELITGGRAVEAVREMISSGWRCDVETYDRVMGALGRL
jgi:predicted nucleic acid-binding protein